MKTLDCRQQQCPHPVIEARKALLADPGAPLSVLVADETACENIRRMAAGQGYAVTVSDGAAGFALLLTPAPAPAAAPSPAAAPGPTVVLVGAETLGQGDDELGRILMRNFLITLGESILPPASLFLVNGGVRLACRGSEAREPLEKLACAGVDIAACGLCLDFFRLRESLVVGRVTNMHDVVETLSRAGRIIRP